MKHPPSLTSGRDFRRVLTVGSVRRPAWGTIHVADSVSSGTPSRLGLAVSARAGGAVRRNRIKRRLRSAFRQAAPATGVDVVVKARPEAASADFQELADSMQGLRRL